MAKGKKQTLTPEERLAQALVPEDEQHYAVPRNWTVTYFLYMIQVYRQPGKTSKINPHGYSKQEMIDIIHNRSPISVASNCINVYLYNDEGVSA